MRLPQQSRPQQNEEIAPDQMTEEPAPDADVMDSKFLYALGFVYQRY